MAIYEESCSYSLSCSLTLFSFKEPVLQLRGWTQTGWLLLIKVIEQEVMVREDSLEMEELVKWSFKLFVFVATSLGSAHTPGNSLRVYRREAAIARQKKKYMTVYSLCVWVIIRFQLFIFHFPAQVTHLLAGKRNFFFFLWLLGKLLIQAANTLKHTYISWTLL